MGCLFDGVYRVVLPPPWSEFDVGAVEDIRYEHGVV